MLSGKDIFRQGKEIVRIVLYKCHIGSYTPRHTKMESKKKKKSSDRMSGRAVERTNELKEK